MLRRYICACPGRPKSCDCRYKHGGYYHAHDDAGRLEFYAKNHQKILAKHYGYFDRLLTLFWYLNDVPAGGETNFPSADNDQPVTTMKKSQRALSLTGCCLAKGIACCF